MTPLEGTYHRAAKDQADGPVLPTSCIISASAKLLMWLLSWPQGPFLSTQQFSILLDYQSSTRILILILSLTTVPDTRTRILTTTFGEEQQLRLISTDMPGQDPGCPDRSGRGHSVTPEPRSSHLRKESPKFPPGPHSSRALNCPNHSQRN